jgi:hypothetical protein
LREHYNAQYLEYNPKDTMFSGSHNLKQVVKAQSLFGIVENIEI